MNMDLEKIRAIQDEIEKQRRINEQFVPLQEEIEKRRRIEEAALGPVEKILREQRDLNELIGPTRALRQIMDESAATQKLRDQIAGTRIGIHHNDDIYRKLTDGAVIGFQNQLQAVLNEANKSVALAAKEALKSGLLNSVGLIETKGLSKDWAQHFGQITASARENVLGLHFTRISELSALAQSSLIRVAEGAVHNAVKSILEAASVNGPLVSFSQSYGHLFESFERSQANFFALPPLLSRLPAVEFFNDADLLKAASTESEEDDEDADEDKRISARQEIRNETFDALDGLLYGFNPEFLKMREGARNALKSDNPDRIRHFTVSYRELFTHILHLLSPDDEVRGWTNNKEHFSNGRPTRKARMLYICRGINQEPFDDFVQKDIESALSVLNFFQQGTHQISCAYTQVQIAALEVRMEATLRFLLEIKRAEQQEN